jgi:hypothetical protein
MGRDKKDLVENEIVEQIENKQKHGMNRLFYLIPNLRNNGTNQLFHKADC